MDTPLITDEDKASGLEYPALGANWDTARRIAEKVMADWQVGAIKPLIDEAVKQIGYRLWEDVQESLQSDMEHNIAGHIRGMVDETVDALLRGEPWALKRYVLTSSYEGDAIRAAIAKHILPELQDKRVADLEAENKVLRELCEYHQRHNR